MPAPFSSFLLVHTMLWHINIAVVRAIFNLNTNIVFYLTTNMHSGPETVRYCIVTTNSRKYLVFSFWEYADVECALAKTKDSSVAHTNARICLFSVAVVLLNSCHVVCASYGCAVSEAYDAVKTQLKPHQSEMQHWGMLVRKLSASTSQNAN